MNRVIGYIVVLIAILLFIGSELAQYAQIMALFFILYGAYSLMIRRKLPRYFLLNFFLLIIGPIILVTIGNSLFHSFDDLDMNFKINWYIVIIIIGMILIGWFGWHYWQNRQAQRDIHSHEREFIIPYDNSSNLDHNEREYEL